MWILIFLFLFSTVILGWILFGYYIWLFLLSILRKTSPVALQEPEPLPAVTIIVPTYNEEAIVSKKIANLMALDYPVSQLQILFVDGGSEDKTLQIIEERKEAWMHIVRCQERGKVAQLNVALPQCQGDIVFVSDADGLMTANAIRETVKEFSRNEQIALVGINSYPQTTSEVDEYYWRAQNKGRLLETQAFTSSIVIAICYAFRKGIVESFPPDVVADDIYISYLVNNKGYLVSYIDRCDALELRAPQDIRAFLSHKFRKSNAFLRESLRFLYKVSEMNPIWKTIFLTKVAQLVLFPWVFFLYVVVGGALVTLQRWDVFLFGSALLVLLLFATSEIFTLVKKEEKKFPLTVVIKTFLFSLFIIFASGISFIFFRQDSVYKRLDD